MATRRRPTAPAPDAAASAAAAAPPVLHHHVEIDDARSHHFRVTLTVPDPQPGLVLALPVWIPGSYLVREFARHWGPLRARQGARAVAVQALDKARWRVDARAGVPLQISARVYAHDPSVRAAYLDEDRGFFNGTSLLLRVEGREARPQRLTLGPLPEGWEVATAMPPAPDGQGWLAADYDELVDHPVELGSFWRGRFTLRGVPHELVVSGAWPRLDGARLLADTRRVCAQHLALWHGPEPAPGRPGASAAAAAARAPAAGHAPPFTRYVFLLQAADEGFGGLEHRASTALIAPRRDLPTPDQTTVSDGYATVLSLISHEYFHSWNVKRLKPAELVRIDYQAENPTRLLWFFEGFTSYYDDLLLLRAGLIDAPRYLKTLSRTLNAVAQSPGQAVQSLAESSFETWIKYYRPDENSGNAGISYYQKGALLALLLDLRLRAAGRTLDALMQRLWQRHAAAPGADGGLTEADIATALAEVAGRRVPGLAEALPGWVHGRAALPLDEAWAALGVVARPEPQPWSAALGLRLAEANGSVLVKQVREGSAAARAGVSAGDELLAVDGWRIRRLDDARAWVGEGQAFELLLAHGQRLRRVRVAAAASEPGIAAPVTLALADRPVAAVRARRRAWLGA